MFKDGIEAAYHSLKVVNRVQVLFLKMQSLNVAR